MPKPGATPAQVALAWVLSKGVSLGPARPPQATPRNRAHGCGGPVPGHRAMSLPRRTGHPGSPSSTHDHVVRNRQIRRAHSCRFPFGIPAAGWVPVTVMPRIRLLVGAAMALRRAAPARARANGRRSRPGTARTLPLTTCGYWRNTTASTTASTTSGTTPATTARSLFTALVLSIRGLFGTSSDLDRWRALNVKIRRSTCWTSRREVWAGRSPLLTTERGRRRGTRQVSRRGTCKCVRAGSVLLRARSCAETRPLPKGPAAA